MSQAFSRLGSHVTVVDTGERILRHDDAELAAVLQNVLAKEDIRFHLQTGIARIEANAAYTNDGHQIAFDAILLATGRQPDFATLNVIAASIQTNEKGIIVDRHCRTSTRHIYACGDVTGKYLFTHMAEHMAKVAATNAITGFPAKTDDEHLTWCTFTDPELAHAGATEDDLRRTGTNYSVYRFPFSRLDRAITESESNGVIKILATRSGRILGASILGAHAGDMIAEWALAMRNRIRLSAIASTIHPYPTYSLGNRRAADLFVTGKLSPTLVRWLQRFRRLRGNATNITRLDA